MSSRAQNFMRVAGPTADLEVFMGRIRGTDWAGRPAPIYFPSTVPIEKTEDGVLLSGDEITSRQVDAWGTKWTPNARTEVLIEGTPERGEVLYVFLTAWGPPDQWIITTSRLFESLSFDTCWCDHDHDAAGRFKVSNGTVLTEDSVEGDTAKLNAWCERNGLAPQFVTDEWAPPK